ncbi:MAG: acetylornithine deacetylase [Nitrospiraceae bacterium]|nr:acetylornithine deacetylase [Nitrospiraceae bacterium]
MRDFKPYLDWIDQRHDTMCQLVIEWANINSHSYNLAGLSDFLTCLRTAFSALEGEMEDIALDPHQVINARGEPEEISLGRMLFVRKRPSAPIQVLLGIHLDTVYPADHPFQRVIRIDDRRLQGPGVADAKGGLVILLTALNAFERSPLAKNIGWEVFLNPDEEIGSPGSAPVLTQRAKRYHLGLLFESGLMNGNLVSERQGTGDYTVVVRGRSAHVGRDPYRGRNAAHALARFIIGANALQDERNDIIVNVAQLSSNGAVNVVPDFAVGRIGVRIARRDDQQTVQQHLEQLIAKLEITEGVSATLHGGIRKPPKVLDTITTNLLENFRICGASLGLALEWHPTAGASDGNILAAAGLPTVDSLGARGGDTHSPREFLEVDSLTERAKLVALFLMKLAAGELVFSPTQSYR